MTLYPTITQNILGPYESKMRPSCQLKQPEANSAKGQLNSKESLCDAAYHSAQHDSIPEVSGKKGLRGLKGSFTGSFKGVL